MGIPSIRSAFPTTSDTFLPRQRIGPISIIRETIAQKGIRGLYAGCTALVTGNAVKAGVRFLSYDQYKSMLRDEEVRTSFRPGESWSEMAVINALADLCDCALWLLVNVFVHGRASCRHQDRCWVSFASIVLAISPHCQPVEDAFC